MEYIESERTFEVGLNRDWQLLLQTLNTDSREENGTRSSKDFVGVAPVFSKEDLQRFLIESDSNDIVFIHFTNGRGC